MQFQTTTSRKNNQERKIQIKYCLLLATCCILIFSNCEDSFQPLKENNKYNFNISGYLDASADTQWVRVGTIRESIDEPPDPKGIEVSLEHVQTGETVVMNDSVFTSKNILNYWTTMDIQHEQTYRITAAGAGGNASEVTVTTPGELPPIYILLVSSNPFYGDGLSGASIYIDDSAEHIVDLQSVWYVTLRSGTEIHRKIYRFPIRNTLRHTFSFYGAYQGFSNTEKQRAQIEQSVGGAEIISDIQQFFVAIGGPEWDESFSSIDDVEYFLDGTGSNVENGLGYVVGISSGWFLQKTCEKPDKSNYAPCEPEEPFW